MNEGRAYSAGVEVLQPYLTSPDPKFALIAAKCFGLLTGYDMRWRYAPYRIDSVESVMQSDLWNPETSRKSRSFITAGKLDIRATEIATGSKVLFDHKTTSVDIENFDTPYWKILAIEGQVSHYMLLEWLHENKVDFGIWDVIRKPSIAPKFLTKKEIEDVQYGREYFGHTASADELHYVLSDEKPRETPMMYAHRLIADCTVERCDWYFQRRKVPRLDAEIREYAVELWGHSQDILATRNSGRWPRNSGACYTYNSPCKFLGICSGHDSVDSGKWQTKTWTHPELPVLNNGRGTDVLTNSAIRVFQSCRRKFYLQYELGIEKVEEEEKEALFFGTLMHNALEQYFLTLQQHQQFLKGTA